MTISKIILITFGILILLFGMVGLLGYNIRDIYAEGFAAGYAAASDGFDSEGNAPDAKIYLSTI